MILICIVVQKKLVGFAAIVVAVIGSILVTSDFSANQTQTNEEPIKALINYRAIGELQEDGLAIMDINPNSKTFSEIIQDVPVGKEVRMHHPFYNYDKSKLYNTSLSGDKLYRISLHQDTVFEINSIDTGSCLVGEDMHFSEDGSKYYLTCMGSDNVMVFDGNNDEIIGEIKADKQKDPTSFVKYPHGISGNEKIDRLIFTETVAPTLDDFGTSVSIVEFSTGRLLSNIELLQDENLPSAPVEVQFHPTENIAYVSGMHDATIWALIWDDDSKSFQKKLVDDGKTREHGMPLDISFGPGGNLYVSFAVPGVVNEYSLEEPAQPKLTRTIGADPGAHHVLFSPDNKYMYVQNNLLNLDGINSGTISVIDFETGDNITTIDNLTEKGMMIESLDLLIPNSNVKVTTP